jgi:CHAT domain-containing protein
VLCPDADRIQDGYFRTLEVMSQPMEVGLVVLSACETARGRIGRGEGVVGLSRAFLASGAGGLVASLWAVSDESTARLMEEFYRRVLDDRKPAGRALNEARLEIMEDARYSHPYHWAAFVAIGLEDTPW